MNEVIIPPWLHPSDPVSAYMEGQRLGAQVGEEQQRLEQERTAAAMRYQVEQAQLQNSLLHQQQQLEVQRAYHDAQVDLRQQRLGQIGEAARQKSEAAAKVYADSQGLADFIAQGGSVAEGLARFPGASPATVGALSKAAVPEKDYGDVQWGKAPNGDDIAWRKGSPSLHQFRAKPDPVKVVQEMDLKSQLNQANKDLADSSTDAAKAEAQQRHDEILVKLLQLRDGGTNDVARLVPPASTPAEPTAPAEKPWVGKRLWNAIFDEGGTPGYPVATNGAATPLTWQPPATFGTPLQGLGAESGLPGFPVGMPSAPSGSLMPLNPSQKATGRTFRVLSIERQGGDTPTPLTPQVPSVPNPGLGLPGFPVGGDLLNPQARTNSAPSPFPEGARLRSKRDGNLYVVRGGVPIPADGSLPDASPDAGTVDVDAAISQARQGVDLENAAAQARAAIEKGADESKVRERFKQITGQDLDGE